MSTDTTPLYRTATLTVDEPLSTEAKAELRDEMAEALNLIESLEEEKARCTKDFNKQIEAQNARLHELGRRASERVTYEVLWTPAPRGVVLAEDAEQPELPLQDRPFCEPVLCEQRLEMVAYRLHPLDPCAGFHSPSGGVMGATSLGGEIGLEVSDHPLTALARFALFVELDRRAMTSDEIKEFQQPRLALVDPPRGNETSAKVLPFAARGETEPDDAPSPSVEVEAAGEAAGTACCAVLEQGETPTSDTLCGQPAPQRGRSAGLCSEHAKAVHAAAWRERRARRRADRASREATESAPPPAV